MNVQKNYDNLQVIFYILIFILKLLPTGNLQTVTDCCRFIADSHIFHYKESHLVCLCTLGTRWLRALLNLCSDCSYVFYQQNGRQCSMFSDIVYYLFQLYVKTLNKILKQVVYYFVPCTVYV